MKKLTKSVIIDMLQKDIADNKRDNEQHNIIYEFLKANDGNIKTTNFALAWMTKIN